jgi:hypothetical protein
MTKTYFDIFYENVINVYYLCLNLTKTSFDINKSQTSIKLIIYLKISLKSIKSIFIKNLSQILTKFLSCRNIYRIKE